LIFHFRFFFSASDEQDGAYLAKKWSCKEAAKLNSAACFLKIGQYRECLQACNDILKVRSILSPVLSLQNDQRQKKALN
jgi:hypothetical protein